MQKNIDMLLFPNICFFKNCFWSSNKYNYWKGYNDLEMATIC